MLPENVSLFCFKVLSAHPIGRELSTLLTSLYQMDFLEAVCCNIIVRGFLWTSANLTMVVGIF